MTSYVLSFSLLIETICDQHLVHWNVLVRGRVLFAVGLRESARTLFRIAVVVGIFVAVLASGASGGHCIGLSLVGCL